MVFRHFKPLYLCHLKSSIFVNIGKVHLKGLKTKVIQHDTWKLCLLFDVTGLIGWRFQNILLACISIIPSDENSCRASKMKYVNCMLNYLGYKFLGFNSRLAKENENKIRLHCNLLTSSQICSACAMREQMLTFFVYFML